MNTDTDDLLTWLRQQIAEDEEAARDAGGCRWQRDGISCVEDADNRSLVVYGEGTPSQEEADHIARHDPATVLSQCEAHRLILTLTETVYVGYAAVQALGLAYRHRPGYQQEWRPQS